MLQTPATLAQARGRSSTSSESASSSAPSGGPRQKLATIIFAGLGGAVLGLSTLSFYGRPQDKLSNIGIGLGLGIIVGTVYTTYRTATEPYQVYETSSAVEAFRTQSLAQNRGADASASLSLVSWQWQWAF